MHGPAPGVAAGPDRQKAPKLDPPKVKGGIYEDNWVTFTREWDIFKAATTIPAAAVPVYLLSCCDQDLKTDVHKEDPTIHTKTEAEVLAAIKKLTVVAVANLVQ